MLPEVLLLPPGSFADVVQMRAPGCRSRKERQDGDAKYEKDECKLRFVTFCCLLELLLSHIHKLKL